MAKQTPFRKRHHLEQIVGVEIETDYAHRQTTDEFRLEAVLDKILRRDVLKQFVVHYLDRLGPETNLSLSHAPRHLLLQFLKRAAHDEKNVAGVNPLAFGL